MGGGEGEGDLGLDGWVGVGKTYRKFWAGSTHRCASQGRHYSLKANPISNTLF